MRAPTVAAAVRRAVNAAANSRPAPTAVLAASPSTEWRSAGSSWLASRNSTMCAPRTAAYAHANSIASAPNAPGTHSAATRNAAIAANIASRTAPSSGSTTLVSHAYPVHDHHSMPSTSIPLSIPSHVGVRAISVVHCVSARTNTRSKNSSSGVTRSPSRITAPICGRRLGLGVAALTRGAVRPPRRRPRCR